MTIPRRFWLLKASFRGAFALLFASAIASPALAEPLKIVTSIAPVQGIVAELSAGRQAPELLVPPGADPHDFTLRPSQIRALQTADIIVLMGNGLEPWWADVADQIGAETDVIVLGRLPLIGRRLLPMRGEQGAFDPHIWLDPDILQSLGLVLADVLAERDPAGRARYLANRVQMRAELEAARAEITAQLAALAPVQLVMGHDSMQYFETAFGLQFAGALSDGFGQDAGAQSLGAIAAMRGPACLVVDVNEANAQGLALLGDAPVVRLDPLGANQLESNNFSANLLRNLAAELQGCAP